MKRLFLFISAMLFAAITVSAQQISKEVAMQKATAFANKANPHMKQMLNLAYKAEKPATALTNQDDAYLYVFNKGFNQGFVIVSGDERCNEILGYCDHGSFDPNNLPPNFKYFLEEYEREIKYMQEHNIQPKAKASTTKENLGYLIKTKWDQSNPYNYYLSGCYTGCVATAMAQIMYYWQWPEDATTTIPAYYVSGNSLSGSSLSPITFEWSKMQLTYNYGDYDDDHAVARLMQYAGHAVKMQYSTSGSGAYEKDIINAMTNYFGYPNDEKLIYRSGLSSTEWADTIYANLVEEIPLIMCGSNSDGGHCFICDGYKDGKYHINWGWSGSYDGYFDLEVMTPEGTGSGASGTDGFTSNRSIVTRIHNPSKIIPETASDSIPISAETIRLLAGTQSLTRDNRVDYVSGDLRYFIPVTANFTDSTRVDTLITGLGYYDDYDNLLGVYGARYRLFDIYGGTYSDDIGSFGAELPYGTYKLYPVYGDIANNQWRKINGTTNRYFQADVSTDGKTITFKPSRGISVEIKETSSSSWGSTSYTHKMTVTNTGSEEYSGGLYIYDEGYITGEVTIDNLAVGASQTEDITDYLGKITQTSQGASLNSGGSSLSNLEVMVMNSLYFTDGLWDNITDLVGLYNFWTENEWDGNNHLGNSVKFSVELANYGYNSSSQNVKVTIFPKGTSVSKGTSKTQSLTLDKYSMGTAEFEFTDIPYGKEYDIEIQYSSFGETVADTLSTYDYGINPIKGIVVYGEETYQMWADADASSWETIPADVYYVDARNSEKASSIVPGTNPNTIYILASGSSITTNLEGKNVIIGTTCSELNLEDGYGFYTPIDFTATKANYKRTFTNGNDGSKANWETLVLPFDVTSVTKDDGTAISWFTDKTEHGKNFWVYGFSSEDADNTVVFSFPTSTTTLAGETPYIITVPAQSSKWADKWVLTGKELTFSGENVNLSASYKFTTCMDASQKYDFIGRTYPAERNMIYFMNEAGNRFENTHTSWVDLEPFRCYFVGYFNNDALTMKMRFGDNETTSIGETVADTDSPTANAPVVYSLDGKALGSDVRQLPIGAYIINGKKVMIKPNMPWEKRR
ncbi:MAG: C10 family peptidase [Prevotella sp.]|nr:C10 family peptidase [Prevotella sp.]